MCVSGGGHGGGAGWQVYKLIMTTQCREGKVCQVLQESNKRQVRITVCADLLEATSESQGEILKAMAQLKWPQGHVRPGDARRKGTDIQSRGDSVFKDILTLKEGGSGRAGKGWNN